MEVDFEPCITFLDNFKSKAKLGFVFVVTIIRVPQVHLKNFRLFEFNYLEIMVSSI
jgi:hypothetical protein